MPLFVIEREIAGADKLTPTQLQEISEKSNEVVAGLSAPYRWVTSYVAGDKIYCIHEAESVAMIERHAHNGGFPANLITEVSAIIGPATAR